MAKPVSAVVANDGLPVPAITQLQLDRVLDNSLAAAPIRTPNTDLVWNKIDQPSPVGDATVRHSTSTNGSASDVLCDAVSRCAGNGVAWASHLPILNTRRAKLKNQDIGEDPVPDGRNRAKPSARSCLSQTLQCGPQEGQRDPNLAVSGAPLRHAA
jgi:hypothetical protein